MKPRIIGCLAALFALSCTYVASDTNVTMGTGQTTTVIVEAHHYFSGTWPVVPTPPLASSDPSVVVVRQSPGSSSITLQALSAGYASVRTADGLFTLPVTVFQCTPVTIRPLNADVAAIVGSPVVLSVIPGGDHPLATDWYQDSPGGWYYLQPTDGNFLRFTPHESGTLHFQARYTDRCGDASTSFTVVASTRAHAVRR
jgi:hypothetical protein